MIFLLTKGEIKAKIREALDNDDYLEIIEDKITDSKGRVGTSKKYIDCDAIIIIRNGKSIDKQKRNAQRKGGT